MAEIVAGRLRMTGSAQGEAGALAVYERERAGLPELQGVEAVQHALRDVLGNRRERWVALLSDGDLDGVVEAYRGLDARARLSGALGELGPVLAELERAVEAEARGEFGTAAGIVRSVGRDLGLPRLEARADVLDEEAVRTSAAVEGARATAAAGDLPAAREALLAILGRHPRHEAARRDLQLLEEGARDQLERLQAARKLIGEGRLKDASARLLALTSASAVGDEARLLLRDVRQRIEHVERGLRSVQRAAHGRQSGSREGIRHELARLDQLELLQRDSEELLRLRSGLEAELNGLDLVASGRGALDGGDVQRIGAALSQLRSLRERLLAPERLDARILELVDDVAGAAEVALERGRLGIAETLGNAAAAWNGDRSIADRLARLRTRIETRQGVAADAVAAARRALASRDLANAEERLVAARAAWTDGPDVVRLQAQLASLRNTVERIERVEILAERRDFRGARQTLGSAGPTPAFLRTRIFDLKRSLAEVEGLDHAFLLRVDDGGEFLVVRGESLTIGNLREGTADLPVLADLAARHARLRRTLSFHGGQVDSIVAENGELRVAGRRTDQHRFVSGDRVRLGRSVEIAYDLPSPRSLTASLRLRGGFQIAGTDRILWMKDRGRDGRILLGAGDAVHVPVRGATHEVELHADRDGRMKVRCGETGRIDGVPFDGEHPVSAGAVVECGGVTFVLQPWSRG